MEDSRMAWEEHRSRGWIAAFVLSAALSIFVVPLVSVAAQNGSERIHKLPPGGPAPRTRDGHPDFSGVWFPNSAGQALNAARLADEQDEVDDDARRQFDPKVTPEEKPSFQP